MPDPLINLSIRDWRFSEGMEREIPESQRDTFTLSLEPNGTDQFGLTIKSEQNPDICADILIEINQGKPCLHVGCGEFGDALAHVFFQSDGVYVVPGDFRGIRETVPTSTFYPSANDHDTVVYRPLVS